MLTSTTFQAWKRYTFSGQTFDRKITKLVATPTTTGGTVSSWALTTGIVTMTSGTPLTWASEFDCHCRFDTDHMKAVTMDRSLTDGLVIGWSSIPVIEVR